MDLKKVMALFERAENATDRKEAQKVLKKIRKDRTKRKGKATTLLEKPLMEIFLAAGLLVGITCGTIALFGS